MGGGSLAAALRIKWHRNADLWLVATCSALVCPVLLITVLSDNIAVALTALFFLYVFAYVWMGPSSSRVQELVPIRSRALAVGIMLFLSNIVGLACGPTVGRSAERHAQTYTGNRFVEGRSRRGFGWWPVERGELYQRPALYWRSEEWYRSSRSERTGHTQQIDDILPAVCQIAERRRAGHVAEARLPQPFTAALILYAVNQRSSAPAKRAMLTLIVHDATLHPQRPNECPQVVMQRMPLITTQGLPAVEFQNTAPDRRHRQWSLG